MKKSVIGLIALSLLALSSSGCSKHAHCFWSGAAIGVLASNVFCCYTCKEEPVCETEVIVECEEPVVRCDDDPCIDPYRHP